MEPSVDKGVQAVDALRQALRVPQRMKKAQYLMAGSVSDIRRSMDKLVEDGNPEYLAWLSDQGLLPLEVVKRQLRIFGEQILPHYV